MHLHSCSSQISPGLLAAIQSDDIWQATPGRNSEELVVFIHGYATTPLEYHGLLEHFHSLGLDVYAPEYPTQPFSTVDPDYATDALLKKIESRTQGRRKVLLCAHSMGCVFLKAALAKLLCVESGCDTSREWRDRTERCDVRLLLLSGTNRGYKPRQPGLGLALNGLHRWFWFTIMGILIGNWLSWIEIQTNCHSGWSWLPIVISSMLTLVSLFGAWTFEKKHCFAWQGAFWAATMVGWLWWGSTVGTLNSVTGTVAVIATSLATYNLSRLFGYKRGVAGFHSAVILAIVTWIACKGQLQVTHLWPATLATILCCILYPWKSGLLLENVLLGSSWVSGVRLRWFAVFQHFQRQLHIVHIFGEDDQLVDDDDQEELASMRESRQFCLSDGTHRDFMLTVRAGKQGTDDKRHPPIKDFITAYVMREQVPPQAATTQGAGFIWRVVCDNSAQGATARSPRLDTESGTSNTAATNTQESCISSQDEHVVIVIHGIRDFGEWQDSLAERVWERAKFHGVNLKDVVVVRYGYFTAFQFLLSSERDHATRSFLDAYARIRTRFPNSKVHVAAHSNGTYVVCNALSKEKGFVKLHNIYFAGSVVSPTFPWGSFVPSDEKSSVHGRIRSDCATKDWPVGALCHILSFFGLLNCFVSKYPFWVNILSWSRIGAGGVDGFTYADHLPSTALPQLAETRHLVGNHGVAIRAKCHDSIADFLLTDRPVQAQQNGSIDQIFRWGLIIGAIVGLGAVVGLYGITIHLAASEGNAWAVLNGALLTIVVIRIMMSV